MWVQTDIYVILKGRNGGLIFDESHSFWDMMEPCISSIQRCYWGSNIFNINGNIVLTFWAHPAGVLLMY